MNPQLNIHAAVRAEGRFRAVVHTGHKYDEFGNVTEYGRVLRETPFSRNKITLTGFGKILTNQSANLCMVVGAGNATPNEADTTLQSYLGKSQTFASATTTRNVTPDANNEVWWRVTKRITFGPGSLGGSSVNVAEAGIVTNVGLSGTNASTAVSARGLIVDGTGSPTTVSVNNAVEYLDVIWEYTEYVKASITGTVTLTIDGVAVVHTYEVRPYWFDNVGGSYNFGGWRDVGDTEWGPNWSPVGTGTYTSPYATNCFTGSLVPISGTSDGRGGLGSGTAADIPIMSSSTYTTNSKNRSISCTWLPSNANKDITVVRVNLGHTCWQVSYSPAIAKINTKQLDLSFNLSYANKS